MTELSKAARSILRRRANREPVEVTPENLEAYRELARAGVMSPVSAFLKGPESVFRFTKDGWERRNELQRSRFMPWAILRGMRRALSLTGKAVSGASSTTSS